MGSFGLLCVGSVFVVLAILLVIWNLLFLLRSEEADGIIVGGTDINEYNSGSHPIVQFKTRDGQTIEFQDSSFFGFFLDLISAIYSRYILKQDQSKVKVAYDPNNPKRARIKDFIHFYNWPLFFSVIGIVMIALSFIPTDIRGRIFDLLDKLPF
jgi:hypothetical protein